MVISAAVSLSVVLALGAATATASSGCSSRTRLALAAAAAGRFRLRLGANAPWPGAGALLPAVAARARAVALLSAVGIHHRRQGSRRVHERRDSDRAAGDARRAGSGRRVGADVRARPLLPLVPAARLLQPAVHGVLDREPGRRHGRRPVSALVPGLHRDRLRPRRPHRRAARGRRVGDSRRAGGVLRGPTPRRLGRRLGGRRPPDAQRRSGLVLALPERRSRDAGTDVRGAAGDRAGRTSTTIRSSRRSRERCSACCSSCASTPCSGIAGVLAALALGVLAGRARVRWSFLLSLAMVGGAGSRVSRRSRCGTTPTCRSSS